jgi:hypothetical protein
MTDDTWMLLVDPTWQEPSAQTGPPPVEAIVGGWPASAGDKLGRFMPNPYFVPATPDSPADPVDAVVRLVACGEEDTDRLYSVMRESLFWIALNDDGSVIIDVSPDGQRCLLAVTAPLHKLTVSTENWQETTAGDLVELLVDHGVDLLLNPGANCCMRLVRSVVADRLTDEMEGENP